MDIQEILRIYGHANQKEHQEEEAAAISGQRRLDSEKDTTACKTSMNKSFFEALTGEWTVEAEGVWDEVVPLAQTPLPQMEMSLSPSMKRNTSGDWKQTCITS